MCDSPAPGRKSHAAEPTPARLLPVAAILNSPAREGSRLISRYGERGTLQAEPQGSPP